MGGMLVVIGGGLGLRLFMIGSVLSDCIKWVLMIWNFSSCKSGRERER